MPAHKYSYIRRSKKYPGKNRKINLYESTRKNQNSYTRTLTNKIFLNKVGEYLV